jgi:hypothetical protein
MTNPPPSKSLTGTPAVPGAAESTEAPTGLSAPKDAGRQAVPSALRPDPHPADGRWAIAWLHISAPSHRGAVPTAKSVCACGRDRMAVGHRKVLALIEAHTVHQGECPLRSNTETRNAA